METVTHFFANRHRRSLIRVSGRRSRVRSARSCSRTLVGSCQAAKVSSISPCKERNEPDSCANPLRSGLGLPSHNRQSIVFPALDPTEYGIDNSLRCPASCAFAKPIGYRKEFHASRRSRIPGQGQDHQQVSWQRLQGAGLLRARTRLGSERRFG